MVLGSVPPILASTALLIHSQLTEWTLTGTATHLPSFLANFCSGAGTTASQPSFLAVSEMSPILPACA